MAKKVVAFLIKLGVSVLLFLLLFRPQTFGLDPDYFGGITPAKMWNEISQVEVHNIAFWLGFALVVKLAGMLAGVLRWRLLLLGQGLKVPFWYMVQSWFIGRTIGIFLPGTIGLDGYRLYDSSRYTGEVIKCTTVIAVEKLIGFIALTFLVFLTFPFGFRLLEIKLPVLLAILFVLGCFVTVSFLLLLNPRVIQVGVAVIPTPKAVRNKLDKLGAAVTAYSGSRASLMLAVFFGLLVHVGTCFMYFGTMMAIRAANTSLMDIFFASPIMIYGTVLGPSVGGEGIREIVFVTLLSGKTAGVAAATFAHLGWWVGELVPFLIGIVVFLFRPVPSKEELKSELAEVQAESGALNTGLHLKPEEIGVYRQKLYTCLLAGLAGGLIAGALIGWAEAFWLSSYTESMQDTGAFWWGPAVYGILFMGVGLGVAGALTFLYLLFDKFLPAALTFGLSIAGSLAAGIFIIGRFRYGRDVLGEHAMTMSDNLMIVGVAMGAGILALVIFGGIVAALRGSRMKGAMAALATYLILVLAGAAYAKVSADTGEEAAFTPPMESTGPNIILVAVDTLRADYLPMYNEAAEAKTPNLAGLANDSVLHESTFAQSSWTKASFGTIFSGLFPTVHSATGKASALPDDVVTTAEILQAGGYYTKGYSNNPNITSTFNYNQGFADYVDLEPDRFFGATSSASRLTLYEVLRKVRNMVKSKLPGGGLRVEEFYQPAERVTDTALSWLDEGRPDNAPFYLFVHYMDPHDPYRDPDKPGRIYARNAMGDPSPEEYLETFKRSYNFEIEYLDEHLGRLFDGLRERDLYNDTVIIFTSDHGEEFYEHGGWWHGLSLYEEQIAIPLIIKLPGNAHAGARQTMITRHVDIAPTTAALAGLQPADKMTGQALVQPNQDLVGAGPAESYAHLDFEGIRLNSVRTETTKLITANEDNKRKYAPVELYNLIEDPGEQNNLAEEDAATKDELLAKIENFDAESKTQAVAAEDVMSPEERAQLEALGYLGD